MAVASMASIAYTQKFSSLPLPPLPDVVVLLLGSVSAFILAYLLTFVVIKLCRKMGWLDQPEERRVHTVAVPRLGGVAMFLAFVIASIFFYEPGDLNKTQVIFGQTYPSELVSYVLLLIAATLIVAVHAYDDVKGLKPRTKLLAQTIAVIIVLGPDLMALQFRGVLLFGFSNPFGVPIRQPSLPWYLEPEISLFIHKPDISWLAIPAVLFTWFWMVGMMNTVNWIDGLDGLATGIVAITGLFITIISWELNQHSIAFLAGIFTGATLGFLPHNWNPAKIFMGDSGSQFLGLGLAVISIMGGAKVALALMVLGIPILDVAVVIINRIRHKQTPSHYDKSHLHHRLLATGLSVRQICYMFYGLTLTFGVLALGLTRIYKFIGIALVGVTMVGLVIWIDYRQRQRGARIELDDKPSPLPTGEAREAVEPMTNKSSGAALEPTPPPSDSTGGLLRAPTPQ
ncbi:MAG TPA: MraY family glycosyltransferase [Ktedonobacteraceae bacterium]|nr:MraY family glycosyltransferase [Ktedonobacteraceae bacterium]